MSKPESAQPVQPDQRTTDSLLRRLPTWLHVSDLQGLAQLATQGVLGVAGLAEQVQGNVYKTVAAPFGLLGSRFVDHTPGASGVRTNGITALVYGSVKAVTRLAGGAANALLSRAAPLVGEQASSSEREAMLSALNGVLGDRLLETANPLTISMSLRHAGQTLPLEKEALARRLPHATGKVLVLMHGLCMNDLQWTSAGRNHGEALAKDLGYTPVYLHYNTGLHTSINGAQLAGLLEQLWQAWPQPVEALALLTHSMGGLVARSACRHAEIAGHQWRRDLKTLVFLGTPHHGAPLEALGSWVDALLGRNAVTRPFARIGQIRSSGITDLRYGYVLDSSWEGADRFERSPDTREPLPLPDDVACFAVAAVTADKSGTIHGQLLGDGLVPERSALGQHDELRHTLAFAPENQWVALGMNHLELLWRPQVTAQLLHWLGR
jgi:hypothetical protein